MENEEKITITVYANGITADVFGNRQVLVRQPKKSSIQSDIIIEFIRPKKDEEDETKPSAIHFVKDNRVLTGVIVTREIAESLYHSLRCYFDNKIGEIEFKDIVEKYEIGDSYWYFDERGKKYQIKICSDQDFNKGIFRSSEESVVDEFIKNLQELKTE